MSAGLFENCTGCVLCSEDNGCITCHHRLFLLIWRDGIRQYGMCVHTCPPGYFGVRGLEVNRCTSTWCVRRGPCASERPGVPSLPRGSSPNPELRLGRAPGPFAHRELAPSSQPPFPAECRSPSCESCFSKDFCMKCKEKFYLHKGQCFRQCPPGTAAQPGTRECQGKRRPLPAPHGSCQRGVATVPLPVPLFPPRDVRARALERVERLHPRRPDLRLQVGLGDAGARGPGHPARGGGFVPRAAGDPKVPPEEALPGR